MDARRGFYESAEDFYRLGGSVVMKLSAAAAIEVCNTAADRGLLVARIEGGIWSPQSFEARLDCIWDGADPPIDKEGAHRNNGLAAQFIQEEMGRHNAFVLTTPPITGWPHKEGKNAP